MLRHLERVVPEDPPRAATSGAATHPMREVTRQVAFDPDGWSPARRAKVAVLFDGLAADWHTKRLEPQRTAPLDDAYERGGVPPGGRCLEVGSGDGANTAFLAAHHDVVVAADLSLEMLRHAPPELGPRVAADAGSAPLRDGAADVVVLVNALLFPREMDRVLAPGGVLVWVNTAGDHTPIHLSADGVEAALPGPWDGLASEAGRGTWAVFRRVAP